MTYLKLLLMAAVSILVVHCGPSSSSEEEVDPASLSENLQKVECLKGVYKGNADVDDNLLTALTTTDDSIVTVSVNHNGKSGAEEQVIFYVESEDDGGAFCSVYGGLSYAAGSGGDASTLKFTSGSSRGAANNRGAVQPEIGFNESSSSCSFEDLHITDDVNEEINDNFRPQRVRDIEKQGDKVASFATLQQKCADLSSDEEAWYSWKFWK